jgi:hypothetical protein
MTRDRGKPKTIAILHETKPHSNYRDSGPYHNVLQKPQPVSLTAGVQHVADKARSRVLTEAAGLDDLSRAMVRTNAPHFACYRMAGDYCQYGFS